MPYKCVHCSAVYSDDASEVLEGCVCRSKFFFYIKEEKIKEIMEEKSITELTSAQKIRIEREMRELTGTTEEQAPVVLDFESITLVKPGKYLIDIDKLFSKTKPRVYRLEDGKYIVDFNMGMLEDKNIFK